MNIFFSCLRMRCKYTQPKHSVFYIIDRATGGSRRLLSLIWLRLNLAKGCAPPVLSAKILFQILHHIFSFWLAKPPPHFSVSSTTNPTSESLDEGWKIQISRGTFRKYKIILTYLTVFYEVRTKIRHNLSFVISTITNSQIRPINTQSIVEHWISRKWQDYFTETLFWGEKGLLI